MCPVTPETSIMERLQLLNNRIGAAYSGCTGLSASRFRLLRELFASEEISQTALQKSLGIDGAAITRHLKQLEALDFVNRRNSPDDNRVTLVQLNERGREHIQSFVEENSRLVEGLLEGFDAEERKVLADMLERMHHNAETL